MTEYMFTNKNTMFITKVIAQCYHNIREFILKYEYLRKVACIKTTNDDIIKIEI